MGGGNRALVSPRAAQQDLGTGSLGCGEEGGELGGAASRSGQLFPGPSPGGCAGQAGTAAAARVISW